MAAIAPNLTVMVGELVGARLIAHAGSLMNLAKHPASTVQILGAEKALFRALKSKHETPKYGLIYHASLIGQSAPKFKGKISRVLAAKSALAIRVDALGDSTDATVGLENRAKVRFEPVQVHHQVLNVLCAIKLQVQNTHATKASSACQMVNQVAQPVCQHLAGFRNLPEFTVMAADFSCMHVQSSRPPDSNVMGRILLSDLHWVEVFKLANWSRRPLQHLKTRYLHLQCINHGLGCRASHLDQMDGSSFLAWARSTCGLSGDRKESDALVLECPHTSPLIQRQHHLQKYNNFKICPCKDFGPLLGSAPGVARAKDSRQVHWTHLSFDR